MWLPWKTETDGFLDLLLRSGLLNEADIQAVLKRYSGQWEGVSKIDKVCSHLVASGAITQWQVDKLRSGRFRGFFWDNYKLIDHLGVGERTTAFLAEDIDTGTTVILSVTPAIRGPMTYEVFDIAN